ncbi:MAG: FGGY-family carbohydrate kinase [Actinomycetota bacterium]
MTEELLLGLDLGTTYAKAAVVTPDGRERAHGRAPTPWRPVPTGAEMDPRDLVREAVAAARQALGAAPEGRVVGVGVTSMAETGALLDAAGEPVAPMIAWHDTRGGPEAEDVGAAIGAGRFSERTGLPVSRLCTLSKYRWMRAYVPAAARGARWLNVAEWMVSELGGEEVAELSLSSRTGFLDLDRREWWGEALELAEAPSGLLPDPRNAGEPAGRVTRALLPEAEGAVLTVSGHDHPCASVGAGATRPGDVFDSCGTAEAFVRPVDGRVGSDAIRRAVAGGATVGWNAVPGQRALMAGFVSGLALKRFLNLLGVDEDGREGLEAAALDVPPGADGITVEGVTDDRATLRGIPPSAGPAHVWRAAVEAVARHSAEVLATIRSVAGDSARLVVTGGWAQSPTVRAVKREFLGPFEEPLVQEAGARGAALIAGIAAGVFKGFDDLPPVGWREPDRG